MTQAENQTKFIYFPLYLSDYVSEARKLNMAQRGAFSDLAVLYFQENLKLSFPKPQIYRMVFAFEKEEQDAIDFILKNYFEEIEEKPVGFIFRSNLFDQIGAKVLKRLEANRDNGKKGGRPKKEPMGLNLGNPNNNPNETILNETKLNQIKEKETKRKSKGFIVPTLQEVQDYCQERKNLVNPEKWLNFYQSNGWKVGKNSMKDWRAAVRTWEGNSFGSSAKTQSKHNNFEQQDYYANTEGFEVC